MRKDSKQSCSYMGGVDNCRSPYPFAATCVEAKRKQHLSILKQTEFGGF